MPGHGTIPGDLTTVSIADCVRSAVEQIEDAGLGDVIVVGTSLAGLTVHGMGTKTRSHTRATPLIVVPDSAGGSDDHHRTGRSQISARRRSADLDPDAGRSRPVSPH